MVNFISLGGWCGTKIALKQLNLFDEASLPFDDVRTSIEGIIDCIEHDFAHFFPEIIEKDPRFHNWAGFVGEYVGFFHPYHDLFDDSIIDSFKRKFQRFHEKISTNISICFLRTICSDNCIDELKYYKKLQQVLDKRYPNCQYIVCYMIPNQDKSQYIKKLDERTFLFSLNDNSHDADKLGSEYEPIYKFIQDIDLFSIIPPPNDITIVQRKGRLWKINDYPVINFVKKDYESITDIDLQIIDVHTPEYTGKKYTLSVGCMFKNESWAMIEWLEHYIHHGIDHFFMINDASTDNSVELLQPYIDRGLVTLFNADWKYYWGRQRDLYNHYLLPELKKTQWLIILDLDEFLWSKSYTSLKNAFACCSHLGEVQFQWRMFGSNGHIKQPDSIVAGFTKRYDEELKYDHVWSFKYAINSNFEFAHLDIHHASFTNKEEEGKHWQIIGEPIFALNHYCCQSREFWNKVKCTRGDSDDFRKRIDADFDLVDYNHIDDFELFDRNRTLGCIPDKSTRIEPVINEEPIVACDEAFSQKLYFLSIGCIFKNESHSLVEWIKYYIRSGVQHFFMINDASTDSSVELLQPYINDGFVTLFHADWDRHYGRQGEMYTHYIFPEIHKTQWLLMVDTDEYLWSKNSENLPDVFKQCSHIPQVQFHHTLFGSNGHIKQPGSIVQSFTRRKNESPTKSIWNVKYAINTNYEFDHLGIHYAKFKNDHRPEDCLILEAPYFILNHYSCQSLDIWNNVKCTRGDGDHYRQRTEEDFNNIDFNEVEDYELAHRICCQKPTVDMVVARYNENLEWIYDKEINIFLDEWVHQIYIYNKGNNFEFVGNPDYTPLEKLYDSRLAYISAILPLPNIGRCDHTYLHHIVENYDNLANITIFVPGTLHLQYKLDKIHKLFDEIRKNESAVFYHRDIKEGGIRDAFYDFQLEDYGSANNSAEKELTLASIRPFGKWYDHHFSSRYVNRVTFLGIFSVDKRDILQHPKSYYEKLLAEFPDSSNPEVGHYFERAWCAVFHPMIHTKFVVGENW